MMNLMDADLLYVAFNDDMTDSEIKECIQDMMPICLSRQKGFCLTISGYDDDPRDLWVIPEALGFMKRLCDLGMISFLEVSTTCKELRRNGIPELPGFGALEVWMCATNRMGKGKTDISPELMNQFYKDLDTANKTARAICHEPPYRTGLKRSVFQTQIPDAPIKHHGYNGKKKK